MILMKKLSSKQVLEILSDIARESLPNDKEGTLHLQYDDDDGVEIFFVEKDEKRAQA
jgi:hypothetical protein